MSKCQNCNHDCHCEWDRCMLISSHIDICECTKCTCNTKDEDKTWENEVVYEK